MKSTPSRQSSWLSTRNLIDTATREIVSGVVDRAAEALAHRFYDEMLADPQASAMLDHAIVNTRLHASLTRWLRDLFAPDTTLEACVATQERTGAAHARMGISIDLVAQGARVLKRGIALELTGSKLARPSLALAVQYTYELVDLALDTMNHAYASGTDRLSRSDEAYRLQFLSQNMKAERERQKSGLLEWAHQILLQYFWDAPETAQGPGVASGSTQFGLWLRHKASLLFDGAPQVAQIETHITLIESQLLPELARVRGQREESLAVVRSITQHVDQIKHLLADMFDSYVAEEDGQDNPSRLLNRRYFPAVAKREIALAQRHDGCFAVAALELDGMAGLRDSAGDVTAERMVHQAAEALADRVRAGDFIFRLADAQLLLLLVEVGPDQAQGVAEGLLACCRALALTGPGPASARLTASIGLSLFDGHPDFQRLLYRAQAALQAARRQGGDRCVVSD
jgi:diguanylate cyclase